jgi:putative nucleotidyltransferase with HDIG domain
MTAKLSRSFRAKVTIALFGSMVCVGALSNFLVYRYTLDSQLTQVRDKLKVIAQTAALMIDGDLLMTIPQEPSAVNTEAFKTIAARMQSIKSVNTPPITYIYTMAKSDKEGMLRFVVDPDAGKTQAATAKGIVPYSGQEYDARRFPHMLAAFGGADADESLGSDEWGKTISGYAPIFDSKGRAVAILGVDIAANDLFVQQRAVHLRASVVMVLGLIASGLIGWFVSLRISKPLSDLADAAKAIASGDLVRRVDVGGTDEFAQLAVEFNEMARRLAKSRKKLYDYFYQVMQSLVKILEAKDVYTRGHSERVAGYAVRIAEVLGLPQERRALLKDAALLHDIGKLGIDLDILHKPAKLTDLEFDKIKQHPSLGEEIIKPIALDEELVNVVRWHHERYDGQGYPDRLKGVDVGQLTSIVAVADTYDAMTSTRPYRTALSHEVAAAEIVKHRGTQFDPQVVDAFVKAFTK